MNKIRLLLLIGLATLASGCGFHLRGSGLAADTVIVYSANNPDGEFARLMQRKLAASRVQLIDGKTVSQTVPKAAITLHLLSENIGRRELTVNTLGRVSEYEMSLTVGFTLAGRSQSLTASREYTQDLSEILAVNEQQNFLLNDMRRDLADQLMRRVERAGR